MSMSQCASPETDIEVMNHRKVNGKIHYGICRNEGLAFQLKEPIFIKLRHCLFSRECKYTHSNYQPKNSVCIIILASKISKTMLPLLL